MGGLLSALPITGADACLRHVSCGAGAAPSLARFISTFDGCPMTHRPTAPHQVVSLAFARPGNPGSETTANPPLPGFGRYDEPGGATGPSGVMAGTQIHVFVVRDS